VARDLEGVPSNAIVDIIVQFKTAPGRPLARGSPPGAAYSRGSRSVESRRIQDYRWNVGNLANDPDIAYISPNRSVRGMLNISVAAINALAPANLGMTGLGIGVAVIDSGVSQSVDMQGVRMVYQESFLPGGVVADQYGHAPM